MFLRAALGFGLLAGASASASVTFLPIPGVREFPEATEAGAIRYACAEKANTLQAYFAARGLRFNPTLVRAIEPHPACHVYYEPSLPGFRIAGERQPIDELYTSLDALSFVAGRRPIGDSLGVTAAVLAKLDAPPRMTVSISGGFPEELWKEAAERHFGERASRVRLRPSGSDLPHPWGQDHLKSGEVEGRTRILAPRRLFEGRNTDGDAFLPLLEQLKEERFVRSKLSWEGGDLMAVHPPKQPGRSLLIHGLAADRYWGAPLMREEYAWVLRTEFGADASVDIGGMAPHVDYVLAFLPQESTAIVADLHVGDPEVVAAIAELIDSMIGARAPTAVRELTAWVRAQGPAVLDAADPLRSRIAKARSQEALLDLSPPPGFEDELDAYMERYCPAGPEECFLRAGKFRMYRVAPDLLKRSLDIASETKLRMEYLPRLLNLMEGQIPGATHKDPESFDSVKTGLEEQGFRVVRVPYLPAVLPAEDGLAWPGVSYVNLLAVGRRVFLPALGLGRVEQRFAEDLAQGLGTGYRVDLVDARSALASNGGVHCVFGIIRRPREQAAPWRSTE